MKNATRIGACAVAGVGVLVTIAAVMSTSAPYVYGWIPGLAMVFGGLALEAKLSMPERRVPPRDELVKVPNAYLYMVGDPLVLEDGRAGVIVAVDRIEDVVYVRPA